MKEVICVNIGQAGVQLANAAWELFCTEHGIKANGRLGESLSTEDSLAFTTFFQEVPTGQYVPRVVSVDLEPTVIDEVRTGAYRNLFHPDQLISGSEDAANNFARGRFSIGKSLIKYALSTIRKAAECCDHLQNMFLLNSFGGGTGSGFTSLLLDTLAVEFANRFRVQLSICISPVLTTSVVEPYNAVLTLHASMEHTDVAILSDNEAMYRICNETLDIPRPTYANLNRLIAHNFSDMTVSMRFESSLSFDIDQLITNLIPYPRIHFPVMSHAPHISENRAEHQQLDTAQITRAVFERNATMVSCEPLAGRYMACCLQYRGDVTPKAVNHAIYALKRNADIKFVEWCPTGFKLGINSQPPVTVAASEMAQTQRAVSMLSNTSAIRETWGKLNKKYDLLFAKRAFVHWFVGEGMEEGELNEARDDIVTLAADYREITEDAMANENASDDARQRSLRLTTPDTAKSPLKNVSSPFPSLRNVSSPLRKRTASIELRGEDNEEDESKADTHDATLSGGNSEGNSGMNGGLNGLSVSQFDLSDSSTSS